MDAKNNGRAKSVCEATKEPREQEAGRGNDTLRFELLSMQARDQTVRDALTLHEFSGNAPPSTLIAQIEFVDRVNTARLKELVAEHGWPGYRLVGQEAAASAVLLVLHADKDVAFQKECLPLLLKAIAARDGLASHGAFLTDRIRVNEGKPQWYGTQIKIVDGAWVIAEVGNGDSSEAINQRRASVGLPALRKAV